jgi:5,6-dimethylbenzimidazole synthase
MYLFFTCGRGGQRGLRPGRQTYSATGLYSTACAVQNLWLAARAESLGVGWVSILDFDSLRALLKIPSHVIPLAYLCIGYVSDFPSQPELETARWERRENLAELIHFDRFGAQDPARVSRMLPQGGRNGSGR